MHLGTEAHLQGAAQFAETVDQAVFEAASAGPEFAGEQHRLLAFEPAGAALAHPVLEAVVDLASPDKHPLAKIGKDVGAAAVLVSALAAVLIGILLLGPPLLQKLTTLIPNP